MTPTAWPTAVDFGAGYTYLAPQSGHEFSIVGGLTYSAMNEALQYQNGIDFHTDRAASQFVSKTVLVGVAGYYFQQITGDSGAGAKLGAFEGRVLGIGPQIGFILPLSKGYQGYLKTHQRRSLSHGRASHLCEGRRQG